MVPSQSKFSEYRQLLESKLVMKTDALVIFPGLDGSLNAEWGWDFVGVFFKYVLVILSTALAKAT